MMIQGRVVGHGVRMVTGTAGRHQILFLLLLLRGQRGRPGRGQQTVNPTKVETLSRPADVKVEIPFVVRAVDGQ